MQEILINFEKCTGCKACEIICSLHHYETINPRKSRIKVIRDPYKGHFYPLIAGPFTDAECSYKCPVVLGGKEYERCNLCRASCPSRPFFKEPGTDTPLKCDMCGDPPDPMCVKFCGSGALTLIEVEEKEEEKKEEVEEFQEVF